MSVAMCAYYTTGILKGNHLVYVCAKGSLKLGHYFIDFNRTCIGCTECSMLYLG